MFYFLSIMLFSSTFSINKCLFSQRYDMKSFAIYLACANVKRLLSTEWSSFRIWWFAKLLQFHWNFYMIHFASQYFFFNQKNHSLYWCIPNGRVGPVSYCQWNSSPRWFFISKCVNNGFRNFPLQNPANMRHQNFFNIFMDIELL